MPIDISDNEAMETAKETWTELTDNPSMSVHKFCLIVVISLIFICLSSICCAMFCSNKTDDDTEDQPPGASRTSQRGWIPKKTLVEKLLSSDLVHNAKLMFELTFMVAAVFYMDLILDCQALVTFWQTNNPRFFMTNLLAMVSAAIFTGIHILRHSERLLGDLSRAEIFLLGMSYVFQCHVFFLCWISWKRGRKHQLLVDAKFAEAAIEAVVSSLVQTYAVVFQAETLTSYQMTSLQLSILGSLISISTAFTFFDTPHGIDEAPGNLTSMVSPKVLLVSMFRLCELTSQITALALFQLATRPYGVYIAGASDWAVLVVLTYRAGGQLAYTFPSVFALMNPMLETHNAVTLPHRSYYLLRTLEYMIMGVVVYLRTDDPRELYSHTMPVVYACFGSTVGMYIFLPCIRLQSMCGLTDENVYNLHQWSRKPFSRAQTKLRDSTLEMDSDTAIIMLKPANSVLKVLNNLSRVHLDTFMVAAGDLPVTEPLSPPPALLMEKLLHILHNCPLSRKIEVGHDLLKFALQALEDQTPLYAKLFVRTKGIHAIADLMLYECSITDEGLALQQSHIYTSLFLRSTSSLVRRLDPIELWELAESSVPRAIAGAILENDVEDKDLFQSVLALSTLFFKKPQETFSAEGVVALLKGVSEAHEDALELRVAVPKLLFRFAEELPLRSLLRATAADCIPLLASILHQLDSAAEKTSEVQDSRPNDTEQPLLVGELGNHSRGGVLADGAGSTLQLMELYVQYMSASDAAATVRCLQAVVAKQKSCRLQPTEIRQVVASKILLVLVAKGHPGCLRDGAMGGSPAAACQAKMIFDSPLLMTAASVGCLASAQELVRLGGARLGTDIFGRNAVHAALESNPKCDSKLIELLADHSPDSPLPTQGEKDYLAALSLERRLCPKGHSLSQAGASLSPSVKLGRWRDGKANLVILRLRNGRLVAANLTGVELWTCEALTEVGMQADLRMAGLSGGETRRTITMEGIDHLKVDGEDWYFEHWRTAGHEGHFIFKGQTVIFDGRGDSTRIGHHDHIATCGVEEITRGVHLYEYQLNKVVMNTYVGICDYNKLPNRFQYGVSAPWEYVWAYCTKPQYKQHMIRTPGDSVNVKQVGSSDKVNVLLDMDRRQVVFFVNDEQIGQTISSLPDVVAIYLNQDSEGDRLTLQQKTPTREMLALLEKEGGAANKIPPSLWQCFSCLDMNFTDHPWAVRQWSCEACRLVVCESCVRGLGTVPNGANALGLLSWGISDYGQDGVEDADYSGDTGCLRWALKQKNCWNKKQLVEAIILAALGGHPDAVCLLLESLKKLSGRSSLPPSVGRFSGGSFDPSSWEPETVALLALHTAIFASRPQVVDALLNPSSMVVIDIGGSSDRDASARGVSASSSDQDATQTLQKANLSEPWFQNRTLPLLFAALNSFCATGTLFQGHEHPMYTAPTKNCRTCSCCGAVRAIALCDTCSFGLCAQCRHLSERPLFMRSQDCINVVDKLVKKTPMLLTDRLRQKLEPKRDIGALRVLRTGATLDWQVSRLKAISIEGKEIFESLGGEQVEDDDDDGNASYGYYARETSQAVVQFGEDSSVFHVAATLPSEDILKLLLRQQVTSNEPREVTGGQDYLGKEVSLSLRPAKDGSTPLHMAAAANRPLQAQILLDANASVGAKDSNGQTPLMLSLLYSHDEVAARLIAFDTPDLVGKTAVLNERDRDGFTALHYAVKSAAGAFLCLQLLKNRADPAPVSEAKITPLIVAVQGSKLNILQQFLQKDAIWFEGVTREIDVCSNEGFSALSLAVEQDAVKVLKDLINAGANSKIKNNGKYPVESAASAACVDALYDNCRQGLDREPILTLDTGSVLRTLLAKDNGEAMAISLCACVGRDRLCEAAKNSTAPSEIEFLLHRTMIEMNEGDKEDEVRTAQLHAIAGHLDAGLISEVMIQSMHRPDTFIATMKFLFDRGAEITKVLPEAIKTNCNMAIHEIKSDSKNNKEILSHGDVKAAINACDSVDTLEILASWFFGKTWDVKKKEHEGRGLTTQIDILRRYFD